MDRPILRKGSFRGTDGNGSDHYSADYYVVEEVEQYIESIKTMKLRLINQRTKTLARAKKAEATIKAIGELQWYYRDDSKSDKDEYPRNCHVRCDDLQAILEKLNE